MASRYTLTVDLDGLLGDELTKVRAYVKTNLTRGAFVRDSVGNKIDLGDGLIVLDSAGLGTASLIDTASVDIDVDGLQYAVVVEYVNPGSRDRELATLGWFSMTADANLADLDLDNPGVTPTWRGSFTAEMEVLRDEAAASAAQAELISGLTGEDAAVRALIDDPGSDTTAGLAAKYAAKTGLDAHLADQANPHAVTKAQVGLANVNNTSDASKPVSTAQAAADLAVLDATAPLLTGGSELREAFWTMADGPPPAVSATRQAMTNFQFYAGAAPYVRSGFLSTTTTASAQAGSYRIAQLAGPVLRVGARFAFSSYTAGGGLLALSIQATSIATKVEGQVPVSPMHFTISPTGWSLDVNDVDNTAVETVASGTFDTALTADGATLHSVEIVLDRDRQQCFVTFPDGQTVVFTDSRFALAGQWVYIEPFKAAGSLSTKTNALVREWWADSRAVEALPAIRRAAVTPWVAPTFSGTWVNSGGTNQTLRYRKVGADRVKLEGVIKSGTIGTSCMTLPLGFRPKAARQFGAASNSLFGAFVVNTDGTVVPYAGSNVWFSIECEFEVT